MTAESARIESNSFRARGIRSAVGPFWSTPLPPLMTAGTLVIMGMLLYGLFLIHTDMGAFDLYVQEDGVVEWLTVVELILGASFSFARSHLLAREGKRAARKVWLLLGLLCLFGAMEEISWGQRIFGIPSPEWFVRHNKQHELNIHNLRVYGVNLNKVVFGKGLAIFGAAYLVAVPLLYRTVPKFQSFCDRWGIPVSQNYQLLLAVLVTILVQTHFRMAKRVGELYELCNCFLFLLILFHPFNAHAFPPFLGKRAVDPLPPKA